MWYPVKLELENFQSFETLSYDFARGRAVSIEGDNRTDEGQKTNGSGKSTFLEALHYALTGSSSNGKRDARLVRRGCDCAKIVLRLQNDFKNESLRIERAIYSNTKSSLLDVRLNNVSQKSKYATVTEGNKYILSLLGLSADDLRANFLVNRKRFVSFFDAPDSAKRELLARFAGTERLLKIDKIVSERIGGKQVEVDSMNNEILKLEGQLQICKEEIKRVEEIDFEEEKERLKRLNEDEIATLRRKESELKTSLKKSFEHEREVNDEREHTEKEYSRVKRWCERLEGFDYNSVIDATDKKISVMTDEIVTLKDEMQSNNTEIFSMRELLAPLELTLKGVVKCPSCKTEFVANEPETDLNEIHANVRELKELIQEFVRMNEMVKSRILEIERCEELTRLQKERARLDKNRSRRRSMLNKLESFELLTLSRKKRECETSAQKAKSTCDTLSYELTKIAREITELQSKKFEDTTAKDVSRFETKMKEIENEIADLEWKRANVVNEITLHKTWGERMKRFYVHLTDLTLARIQNATNAHLEDMDSDLRVKLDGFKILADGRMKDSVNATVERGTESIDDWKCFSGGECGRLTFAMLLTLSDMLNEKSESGGLDLLVVDEVLDAVDAEGMKLFMKMAGKLGRTLFVISQVKTDSPANNVMTVIKENGVSRVA